MPELTPEERQLALDKLKNELIELVGRQLRGLTKEELDECWQEAKDYWNVK